MKRATRRSKRKLKAQPSQTSDIGWVSRPRSNSGGYEENEGKDP